MPKIIADVQEWFDVKDDPYHGKVLVRLPKKGEMDQILERTREMTIASDGPVVRMNGSRVAMACAAVKDWKNFIDENDEPLKCTKPNIERMCAENWFFGFVDNCLKELEAKAQKAIEDIEKN